MAYIQKAGTPINLAASGIVSNVAGSLLGFYVNSTNAGTIALLDGTASTSDAVTGTITPVIGWHRLPTAFPNGCYATIGGTALNVTLIFAAG